MKHVLFIIAVAGLLAAPVGARAQWAGMPLWNNPKGGTGITINGDYGKPDSLAGKGDAWGGRVSLGLGTLSFTAGVATWKPGLGATQSFTSVGGNAAMRLIGGSLLPIAVNLQVGAARTDSANAVPAQTAVTGAVGVSVPLPMPYLTLEPYVSPGIRYRHIGGSVNQNSTEFGYAVGANIGYGQFGVHIAYDNEKLKGGGTRSVFGIGASLGIHLGFGM
jgi:hypothetical protein